MRVLLAAVLAAVLTGVVSASTQTPRDLDRLYDAAPRRAALAAGGSSESALPRFVPRQTLLRPAGAGQEPEAGAAVPEPAVPARGPLAVILALAASSAAGAVFWLGAGLLTVGGAAFLGPVAVRWYRTHRHWIGAAAMPLFVRPEKASGRLGAEARPERYDLAIVVEPEAGRFSGTVRIALRADAALPALSLHALGLEFKTVVLDGRSIAPSALALDAASETVSLTLDEPLAPGGHVLELSWTGELGRHMKGLYLSTGEHEGRTEHYAFTHFEPTDARRMFPCFDEPAFKAVFRLTVTAPEGLTVLSNMPAVSERREGGRKTTDFAETPRMSTYLLAMAAGRLLARSRDVDGVPVTVWTGPAQAGQAGFALDVAEVALRRLNAYFAFPYGLPKLDLVAVPDFAAGAMENWGVVFFRDSALLIDPALSSTRAQRRVAEVVAHELVHQWFGNLVTMRWWNDLWLNEAFATWLAYKVVDGWRPEWDSWLAFDARRQGPLAVDALSSTRPVRAEAVSSAEIRAMFDGLTYAKGGTILRMIEAHIGEDAFTEGVRLYMRRHAYGNTEADDLWAALEEASGEPVGRIARDWLTQPGYPLVMVESLSSDNRRLRLSQTRFTADGRREAVGAAGRWAVPLVLAYGAGGGSKRRALLLDGPELEVELDGPADWVYPNHGEKGFFRVSLDERLLGALQRAPLEAFSGVERTGLLSHLWAEARAGTAPVERFLDALLCWKEDQGRPMSERTAEAVIELQDGLLSPEDAGAFARFSREVLGGRWRRLGWDGPGDDESRLARAAVLAAYGRGAGDAELEAQIDDRAAAVMADPAAVEAALVSPLLTLAARRGGRELHEAFKAKLSETATPEQRDQYLKGLSSFADPALARETLALTLGDAVRAQDLWKPWLFLLRGVPSRRPAWDFLKEHWREVRAKSGPRGAAAIIEGLGGVHDAAIRAEAEAFFAEPANMEPTAKRALAQSLELMASGAEFETRARAAFSRWLRARYP
ncbi:MAG: M1 family metallopeptidase [Elusimicrobia bacterium]|nr:M1 family metallopeptidase [Elusimicrobiota bacterium]